METWQVETAAFESALESARHFDEPKTREHLIQFRGHNHPELTSLLNDSHFIAIRVFSSDGEVLSEAWKSISNGLQSAVTAHVHDFPTAGASHRNWIRSGGEDFVQVVLPLAERGGKPMAYFEGIYRIDARMQQAQKERVRNSSLIALISAFAASILFYPILLGLTRRSMTLSQSLLESNIEMMQTLGSAIAKRDSDTDSHNYRVALYTVRLAESMHRPNNEIMELITGAFLHDIGKIGISDQILLKPGKLTPDEFETMKLHVTLGEEIIAHNSWLLKARTIVGHHHEKFNGSGYPNGLKGHVIPFSARLFAVVDVFDALTSKRPYKPALPLAEATKIIDGERGRHFDPEIVEAFLLQAERLYDEIGCASRDVLQRKLAQTVQKYFGRDTSAPG
ncbi:MAG: HD domain-containing protein [Oxalobacter sp.]|nr:MAG: HD domain-containing protein [Oxalobacter sp.]